LKRKHWRWNRGHHSTVYVVIGEPPACSVEYFHVETAMNQAVHQLLQLILQGLTWFLRTLEALWDWSWKQISSAFNTSWANLPGWKIAVAIIAIAVLAALLLMMIRRGLAAFGQIAHAFWTMALTMFGVLTFIVIAGLFSRGFQWVVASIPDDFWTRIL
jgi:hypothetical protein